jgi:hypothetical protein
MSKGVRYLAPTLRNHFPGVTPQTNVLDFVRDNRCRLQDILDHAPTIFHIHSTQSGDDVVSFNNEPLDVYLKIAYTIFGQCPSENTWYISKTFAIFCEEIALQTPEHPWEFIEQPKPRTFSWSWSKVDSNIALSKISLLATHVQWMKDCPVKSRSLSVIDHLIRNDLKLFNFIRDERVSLGVPNFLGGIGHPGHSEYSESDKKIIYGLSQLTPGEVFSFLYSQQDRDGIPLDDVLRPHLDAMWRIGHDHIVDLGSVLPRIQGTPIEVEISTRDQYKRDQRLVSMFDALESISRGFRSLEALKGVASKVTNPLKTIARRRDRLLSMFRNIEVPDTFLFAARAGNRVKDNCSRYMHSHVFPKEYLDTYLEGLELPLMSVRFRSTHVGVGQSQPPLEASQFDEL